MRTPTVLRRVLPIALVLACADGAGPDDGIPTDLGTALHPTSGLLAHAVAWSATGELAVGGGLFVARPQGGVTVTRREGRIDLVPIPVGSATVDPLAWRLGVEVPREVRTVWMSDDARHLALSAEHGGGGGSLWAEAGAPPRQLSELGSAPLPTPDGRLVAYRTGVYARDSVFLFSPATGASRFLTVGCTALEAWSPDGRQLLCSAGSNPAFTVVRTYFPEGRSLVVIDAADGTSHPITVSPAVAQKTLLVRWDRDGIHLIYNVLDPIHARRDDLHVLDLATGRSSRVWLSPERWLTQTLSWSEDRRRLIVGVSECIVFCYRDDFRLYNVDVASASGRPLLRGGRDQSVGFESLAIAPGGARVAYVLDGRAYVKDLTP